jgi:hypothetical protein
VRRLLLNAIGLAAALVAAVLVWVGLTLPPAAVRPSLPAPPPELVTGAYHVHTSKSDGSGTVDEVARAASRAGLQFVIITDHGDATRIDPPAYRHGVLCIDAVEVSSTGGHVVALNLRSASPFPLAGETRDVIEDIHRLGGWAVAAHPDSPRATLRWRAGGGIYDGIEWLNADSEWRGHSRVALTAAAARALFRPAETVASLFQLPRQTFQRWDATLGARPVFSLAAVDAHARLGEDPNGPATQRPWSIPFPGYESMFRTVTQTVRLERPFGGDAASDAAAVLTAIGAGRSYSVVRAFVDAPKALEFSASLGRQRVDLGGALAVPGPFRVRAAVPAETGARLVLLKDGRPVASGSPVVEHDATGRGVYRVEAHLDGRAIPWIVSNAIRVGDEPEPGARPGGASTEPRRETGLLTPLPAATWVVEADASSTGTIATEEGGFRLRYRLGGGPPAGQFVAVASAGSGSAPIERIEFVAVSPTPIRMSVQVRLPGGGDGQRWRRSIYVDDVPRRISVPLAEFEPVDRRSSLRPISARVQSVLLVIDTVNLRPGTGGEVVFRDLGFVPGRSTFSR